MAYRRKCQKGCIELASYRAKKIMDVFNLNDEAVGKELMTYEVREQVGKDEKTLAELQMQTYLIMSDFCQKKNKKGQSYGRHVAVRYPGAISKPAVSIAKAVFLEDLIYGVETE